MRSTYISDDGSRKTTQFNYNQSEKRLTINDYNGLNLSYTFDELGRKTQITVQDGTNTYRRGQEIAYEYNNSYQVTKETHSDGLIIEYEYRETTGLLTSIRDNSGENNTQFNYSQAENKFSIIHPSGLVHSYIFDL